MQVGFVPIFAEFFDQLITIYGGGGGVEAGTVGWSDFEREKWDTFYVVILQDTIILVAGSLWMVQQFVTF